MNTTRRVFLKSALATGFSLALPKLSFGQERHSPNDQVRLGIIGLGGLGVVGGVGGRGRQLIAQLRKIPSAKIVALCDVDSAVLEHELKQFKDRSEEVKGYGDLRRLLEDKSIDAVVVATPNHWHALAAIWACQAGKDVYVEKPFSYSLSEGRQVVAAARKYDRIIQVGTQNRSSAVLQEAFDFVNQGQLGKIQFAHALVYRPREGINGASEPLHVPNTVDYDLWCGPAEKVPLMRTQFHYEWHWFWNTGNGEMGNNGIHVIDVCRWGLGQARAPGEAISLGGRYHCHDNAETPNTQIALFNYQPAPLICEVRNVKTAHSQQGIGKFRNLTSGIVIDCESGYLAGDGGVLTIYDKSGKEIRKIQHPGKDDPLEGAHLTNFLQAVRSRRREDLHAEAAEGHRSTSCCHLANISYRLGTQHSPDEIHEQIQKNTEFLEAFERCRAYLLDNGVDLGKKPAVLGPWLTYDPERERFTGAFAESANRLARREGRAPYSVPQLA